MDEPANWRKKKQKHHKHQLSEVRADFLDRRWTPLLPTRPPRGAASKNCIRFFPAAFREGPRWNLAPNLTQRRPQSLQNHRLQRRHLLNRQRRKRRHRCHLSRLDSPGNKHVTGPGGSQAQEANKWQALGANRPRGRTSDQPWALQVTGRPRLKSGCARGGCCVRLKTALVSELAP